MIPAEVRAVAIEESRSGWSVKRSARTIAGLALAMAAGCGGGADEEKAKISMSKVPGTVLKAAEKARSRASPSTPRSGRRSSVR